MKYVEFTEYIAQDGSVYKFDIADRFLLSDEGLGMPPVEYITQKGPFQHGETLLDFRLGKRTVQLVMRQNGCSREDYWNKRSTLINAIKPNNFLSGNFTAGVLRKYLANGEIRDLNVIIEQGPIFTARSLDSWDEHGFTETLRFIAHDPIFYNPLLKNVFWESFTASGDLTDLVFPTEFPITLGEAILARIKTVEYLGSWRSFPTIRITGPQNAFTIYNRSTNEKISLDYNISSGEIVIINLQYGNKTVVNTDGDNLLGTVTSDSDLATFHLAPHPEAVSGLNNLEVQSTAIDENSQVLVEFRERFIGI